MSQTIWYTREYRCANGVCEKTKFPVRQEGKTLSYSSSEGRRAIRRAEKNATQAKHEASRIVNNNFRAGHDALVTLTVSDEGMDELVMKAGTDEPDALLVQLRKELKLAIRRARYALKPTEGEFRYFAVPSDRDGKTLQPVRVHAHIIITGGDAAALCSAWKLGSAGIRTLYGAHHGDLTDLVEYLLDQARTVGTEKRYIPSRNLVPPEASRPHIAKNPDAALRVPKGCSIIWTSEQRAGRPQKIRYYRPPKGGAEDEHDA